VLSSYDAESLSGGTVLNQARYEHNNYGQRVSTYQAQTGAVNVSATPRVQTSFADGAANTVRPVSLTYPDGRVVSFDYGAAGSMNDRCSRIAALKQGSTTLAEYEFLGLGAVVQQTSPEANLRMTLVDLTGSNDPETGDLYGGLDRFGRLVRGMLVRSWRGGLASMVGDRCTSWIERRPGMELRPEIGRHGVSDRIHRAIQPQDMYQPGMLAPRGRREVRGNWRITAWHP
jgi:hypothetical protein